MTYGSDEYWEARRADLVRARRRREMANLLDAAINALLSLLALAAVLCIAYMANREMRERAAYNQGRFGVDRATAFAMAVRGVGKCAADVLGAEARD